MDRDDGTMDEQDVEAVAQELAATDGIRWHKERALDPLLKAVYGRYKDRAGLVIAALNRCRAKQSAPEKPAPQIHEESNTKAGAASSDRPHIRVGTDVFYRPPSDRRQVLCSVERVHDGRAYIVPYSKPQLGWVDLDELQLVNQVDLQEMLLTPQVNQGR
jgi:hypothetical protein